MSYEDNFDIWDYLQSHEFSLDFYKDLLELAQDGIYRIQVRMEQDDEEAFEMDLEEVK